MGVAKGSTSQSEIEQLVTQFVLFAVGIIFPKYITFVGVEESVPLVNVEVNPARSVTRKKSQFI